MNFFLYSRLNSNFFFDLENIRIYSTVAGSVRSNINNDTKTQIHISMKNETRVCTRPQCFKIHTKSMLVFGKTSHCLPKILFINVFFKNLFEQTQPFTYFHF